MRVYARRVGAIRPRAEWDEDRPFLPALTVFEPGHYPRETGLLDKDGNDLVAFDHMEPIGYVRFEMDL